MKYAASLDLICLIIIKCLLKKFFFGKEYLAEISFYKKLGYNKFQIPKTQFLDLEFKKSPFTGAKRFYNSL